MVFIKSRDTYHYDPPNLKTIRNILAKSQPWFVMIYLLFVLKLQNIPNAIFKLPRITVFHGDKINLF